jgi:hypothetical protein
MISDAFWMIADFGRVVHHSFAFACTTLQHGDHLDPLKEAS